MPLWVYASWAIGLFLYQTFDAVDGTQAYVRNHKYLEWSSDGFEIGDERIKVGLWESYLIMVYETQNWPQV